MKLGRVIKELCILLIVGMLSCPILGVEVASTEVVTVSTTSVSQEAEGSVQISEAELLESEEKELQFMRQYGKAVNISLVKDHLKITVESMLTDAYGAKLLISVEALEGTTFKARENLSIERVDLSSKKELEIQARLEAIPADAPYVEYLKVMAEFEEGLNAFIKADDTVDEEGLMAYLQEGNYGVGSASASYGQCYTKENTIKKVYFIYKASFGEASSEEMVLCMESVMEEEEKNENIASDLVRYLTNHQDAVLTTVPNVIDEHERVRMEELKQTNEALYLSRKEEQEKEPQILLGEQGLGLSLIEGDNSFVIDNIGFIEGKLHILMIGQGENRYHLEVYDQAGEWVSSIYNTGSSRTLEDGSSKNEKYCVYDIGSVEELKKYNFKVNSRVIIGTWEGPWEINLDMSRDKGQVIKVGRGIPYTVTEKANLNEIYIGECSIALFIDGIKSELNNKDIAIKIKFKDGTEEELTHSRASSRKADKQVLVYQMGDKVGKDIQSIVVGNSIIYNAS